MERVKNIGMLVFGNFLMAFAIGAIAFRLGISMGGVSGFAKVLANFLPLPISVIVWIVNGVLFLLGWICVGKEFAMRSVFSIVIFPMFLEVSQKITIHDVLSKDLLLATGLAGVLLGSGAGLVLRGNGSSGGFDVLAVTLEKYFSIKVAITNAICDIVVLALQINPENLLSSIYGIVMILITNALINRILSMGSSEVKVMVFSKEAERLKELLMGKEDCGVTLLKAQSGYQNQEMNVIVSVIPYAKLPSIKQTILDCDPNAFLILEDVQAAYTGNYRLRKPEDMVKAL